MNWKNILKQIGIFLLWFIIIVAFEALTCFGRGIDVIGIKYDNIIMLVKYFLLTYWVLRKWEKYTLYYLWAVNIFLLILIYPFVNELLLDREPTIIAWTNTIMGILGIWLGYWFYKTRNKAYRISIIGMLFLLPTILLYNYRYIDYYNAYGQFKLVTNIKLKDTSFQLFDKQKNEMTFQKDHLYILDFWFTGCTWCFKKFPEFEKRYKTNKNPNISYISINKPMVQDNENLAFEMVEKKGFTFPVWKGAENIGEYFDIYSYPTVIALRNDSILYKGNQERLDDFLETIK
ncbi:MAG TPA: hypothetical protein PKX92_04865 [Edaphocola sp.]|nr:hypothetical protein [Edaphocola sp.]